MRYHWRLAMTILSPSGHHQTRPPEVRGPPSVLKGSSMEMVKTRRIILSRSCTATSRMIPLITHVLVNFWKQFKALRKSDQPWPKGLRCTRRNSIPFLYDFTPHIGLCMRGTVNISSSLMISGMSERIICKSGMFASKSCFVKGCYTHLIHLLLHIPSLLKSLPFFRTTVESVTRSQRSIPLLETCGLGKARSSFVLHVGSGWACQKEKRRMRLQ